MGGRKIPTKPSGPAPDPEFSWYSAQSRKLKLPPRCPIASTRLCPRYYFSLSLLGETKIFTKIDPSEDHKLFEYWKKSHSFPTVREEEPSFFGPESGPCMYNRFCPEITYDALGIFASNVAPYADETDLGIAHVRLRKEAVPASDWRWSYSSVRHKHYTECKEFSAYIGSDLVAGIHRTRKRGRPPISPETRWVVFARDSFTCQYCGACPPKAQLELDHRVAKSRGGEDDEANLVTCLFGM